jgi:hypothetical protein
MAMTPRIEAIRRLMEMLAPIVVVVVAVVEGVVVVVVVVVPDFASGVVDIFYQRRGYIPRWILPGMF